MPLPPLSVNLTDGQKIEVMKRFRKRWSDDLDQVQGQMTDILTALQEADFLAPYVGEQPEVVELRKRKGELDALEKRRQYLAALIERLDAYTPKQAEVKFNLAGGTPAPGQRAPIKRY